MTKKSWFVLAGIMAACVCLTLAVLALLPPRPGVTRANIDRIEDGMTLAEVEKILAGRGPASLFGGPIHTKSSGGIRGRVWHHPHDGTYVAVYFDRENRVIRKDWGPPETFMQKLRRLLHLRRPSKLYCLCLVPS
jgi:hypothetical protein